MHVCEIKQWILMNRNQLYKSVDFYSNKKIRYRSTAKIMNKKKSKKKKKKEEEENIASCRFRILKKLYENLAF